MNKLIKTTNLLTGFISIFSILSCNRGHCTHEFEYNGKIDLSNFNEKDSISLKFQNLGSIIFKTNLKYEESASIDKNGNFTAKGNFYTVCISMEDELSVSRDSLSYIITNGDYLIEEKKLAIVDIRKEYIDEFKKTKFFLPTIKPKNVFF